MSELPKFLRCKRYDGKQRNGPEINWRYFGPYLSGAVLVFVSLGVAVEVSQLGLMDESYPTFEVEPNEARSVTFLVKHDEKLEIKISISGSDKRIYNYFQDVTKEHVIIERTRGTVSDGGLIVFEPDWDGEYVLVFDNSREPTSVSKDIH